MFGASLVVFVNDRWIFGCVCQRRVYVGSYLVVFVNDSCMFSCVCQRRVYVGSCVLVLKLKKRLAVSCFRSVSKASTSGPLHTLTSEFGWDLVLVCGIWPIAQEVVLAIALGHTELCIYAVCYVSGLVRL